MSLPRPILLAVGVLLLGVVVYYAVAAAAFLRLFFAAMDPSGRSGRWARKLFRGTAAEIEDFRRGIDPQVLATIDVRMHLGIRQYLIVGVAMLLAAGAGVLAGFLLGSA